MHGGVFLYAFTWISFIEFYQLKIVIGYKNMWKLVLLSSIEFMIVAAKPAFDVTSAHSIGVSRDSHKAKLCHMILDEKLKRVLPYIHSPVYLSNLLNALRKILHINLIVNLAYPKHNQLPSSEICYFLLVLAKMELNTHQIVR